jgi:hypothetical protein
MHSKFPYANLMGREQRRPSNTWANNIKVNFRKIGCDNMKWNELASG